MRRRPHLDAEIVLQLLVALIVAGIVLVVVLWTMPP